MYIANLKYSYNFFSVLNFFKKFQEVILESINSRNMKKNRFFEYSRRLQYLNCIVISLAYKRTFQTLVIFLFFFHLSNFLLVSQWCSLTLDITVLRPGIPSRFYPPSTTTFLFSGSRQDFNPTIKTDKNSVDSALNSPPLSQRYLNQLMYQPTELPKIIFCNIYIHDFC